MTIEVRALVRSLPDGRRLLDEARLSLSTPCFAVLTGRNGSGKTLLIRHIMGLEKPQEGGVFLDGLPLEECLTEARERIALVFQEPEHQILGITVREDLEFGLRRRVPSEAERSRRMEAALVATGLVGTEERLTAALSGGEKRRLAIATALLADPELIILDEPFNGLDWSGVSALLRVLLGLKDSGVGILLVTHDLEKCLAHADTLVVLEAGRVVREGGPEELWDSLPGLGLRRPEGPSSRVEEMTWIR